MRTSGPSPLLVGFILLVAVIDPIMPGVIPKWVILALIFIPLFYRLGIAPQTVIAAYRVGDGPMNVITPLMVYLPFIVLVCQRYQRKAGLGTVVSMMTPYAVIVLVTWVIFFVVWYLVGIPWGPRRARPSELSPGPSRPRPPCLRTTRPSRRPVPD